MPRFRRGRFNRRRRMPLRRAFVSRRRGRAGRARRMKIGFRM